PPMNGEKGPAAEQRERLERVLGTQVDVAPGGMESTDLEHDEVERSQPVADVAVLGGKPGVAAEEHAVPRGADRHRRPQGRVAVLQAAAREMLRWGRGDRNVGVWQPVRLPPVELDDAPGAHAPRLEMRADAERRDERHVELCERAYRGVVEV